MTQVTDEMVKAAADSDARYDGHESLDILGRVHRERYIARSRAALEAALAVREPDAGDWAAFGASDAACHKWSDDTPEHKALRAAYIEGAAEQADMIERQAEEIALHKEVICMLTTDRAELIEALRPFVYPTDNAIQRAVALDSARALLERLGAVPGHGWHDLSKHPERDL